jgi:hypothetical protein
VLLAIPREALDLALEGLGETGSLLRVDNRTLSSGPTRPSRRLTVSCSWSISSRSAAAFSASSSSRVRDCSPGSRSAASARSPASRLGPEGSLLPEAFVEEPGPTGRLAG